MRRSESSGNGEKKTTIVVIIIDINTQKGKEAKRLNYEAQDKLSFVLFPPQPTNSVSFLFFHVM
jgi:hypothetical protein